MASEREDNWSDAQSYRISGLRWRRPLIGGPRIQYVAKVGGKTWKIRLNNFPDEPAYTLIAGRREVIHFNDWPPDGLGRADRRADSSRRLADHAP